MKRLLIVVLVVVLSGCEIQNIVLDTYYGEILIHKTNLYCPDDFNVDVINGAEDISRYIRSKVSFSTKNIKKWRSMGEVLESGEGDCKSYSILFAGLYYIKYGIKCDIVFTNISTREIVDGGQPNHCIVEAEGVLIEPQTGRIVHDSIMYRYDFEEVFN